MNRFRSELGLEAVKTPESAQFFKDSFQEIIAILMDENIKIISFTFGLPSDAIRCTHFIAPKANPRIEFQISVTPAA